MTTTALVVSQQHLTPDVLQMIMNVAPTMHNARLFGTKTPEQAAAIMIKGFELGFSITASFENIHVIEEKPSLSPKGALALIYASPEFAGIKITDEVDNKGVPLACTVWMKRKNGFEYTAKFSMEDAKRAGLVKDKSGWEKYPANMMRYRAIGYCADITFPDVIGGTKRADEYGADLTPDGDVIEGSWSNVGPQQATTPAQPAPVGGTTALQNPTLSVTGGTVSQSQPTKPAITLQSLLESYGPEKVLAANNGVIPGTLEDCEAVAAKLGGQSE